ncbi:unnamed protein product [Cyprideis torosa]|uniref:Uncharacterized protein n=1 Tax=Cyprideis torosa TaxID=163714 RepID=A0A7R8W0G1_9CRUS|nr:unnamed protein product [Cyprideis torosa]CAG0879519.1 unnamed protein product [Cyprideis torosa]
MWRLFGTWIRLGALVTLCCAMATAQRRPSFTSQYNSTERRLEQKDKEAYEALDVQPEPWNLENERPDVNEYGTVNVPAFKICQMQHWKPALEAALEPLEPLEACIGSSIGSSIGSCI